MLAKVKTIHYNKIIISNEFISKNLKYSKLVIFNQLYFSRWSFLELKNSKGEKWCDLSQKLWPCMGYKVQIDVLAGIPRDI